MQFIASFVRLLFVPVLVLVLVLMALALALPIRDGGPSGIMLFVFVLSVVLAPLFFLVEPWLRLAVPESLAPAGPVVLALVTIAAVMAHPVFDRPWAKVVTLVGLFLWFLCEFISMGAHV